MKGYVLGAALLAVCAWGYLQTKKLSDSGIEAYYQRDSELTLQHDAEATCALIADDFRGSSSSTLNGTAVPRTTFGKADSCSTQKKIADMLETFKNRLGREPDVSYSVKPDAPVYAADHRSATVHVTYDYSLLHGHLLHLTGTRVDTLVKRDGKVLALATEDHSTVTMGAP